MPQMKGVYSFIFGFRESERDSRGIDVVRNKIKGFAQKKVTLPPGRHKIVILDEADRCVSLSHICFTNNNTIRFIVWLQAPSRLCDELWKFSPIRHDFVSRVTWVTKSSNPFRADALYWDTPSCRTRNFCNGCWKYAKWRRYCLAFHPSKVFFSCPHTGGVQWRRSDRPDIHLWRWHAAGNQ